MVRPAIQSQGCEGRCEAAWLRCCELLYVPKPVLQARRLSCTDRDLPLFLSITAIKLLSSSAQAQASSTTSRKPDLKPALVTMHETKGHASPLLKSPPISQWPVNLLPLLRCSCRASDDVKRTGGRHHPLRQEQAVLSNHQQHQPHRRAHTSMVLSSYARSVRVARSREHARAACAPKA